MQRIEHHQGQQHLFDAYRYRYIVTDLPASVTTQDVVDLTYERCDQENVIEQLGAGLAAWRMPVAEFDGNSAWLEIARLAWNLGKWIAQLALPDEVVRWEWKRFARPMSMPPHRSSVPAGRPSSGSARRTAGTSRSSPRMCGSRRRPRPSPSILNSPIVALGSSSSGQVCLPAAGEQAGHMSPRLVMHYEADVFPGGLTVSSRDPTPRPPRTGYWRT